MQNLIFASTNVGKIKEVKSMLGDTFNVLSLSDISLDVEVVEDQNTFLGNAIKKAREISNLTGKLVLADDSGLEIEFLDGKPGVFSHRWLGEDTPQSDKHKEIFRLMSDIPDGDIRRKARFVTSMALANGNKIITSTGTLDGLITTLERGSNGFGYDPIFLVEKYNQTLGEMSDKEKNEISHRRVALGLMKDKISILI